MSYKPMSHNKILYIRKLYSKGKTMTEIADMFGVSIKTIDGIINPEARKKTTYYPKQDMTVYATKNPLCRKCKYRTVIDSGLACYYMACTGERRGCPPKDCEKFAPGTPVRATPLTGRHFAS